MVERTIYAEIPPRVTYELTERGASLRPVLMAMLDWGEDDRLAESSGG